MSEDLRLLADSGNSEAGSKLAARVRDRLAEWYHDLCLDVERTEPGESVSRKRDLGEIPKPELILASILQDALVGEDGPGGTALDRISQGRGTKEDRETLRDYALRIEKQIAERGGDKLTADDEAAVKQYPGVFGSWPPGPHTRPMIVKYLLKRGYAESTLQALTLAHMVGVARKEIQCGLMETVQSMRAKMLAKYREEQGEMERSADGGSARAGDEPTDEDSPRAEANDKPQQSSDTAESTCDLTAKDGLIRYRQKQLDIPCGRSYEVFETLIKRVDEVVPYRDLGSVATPKEADDTVRHAIGDIRIALEKTPYEVKTHRQSGYQLRRKPSRK